MESSHLNKLEMTILCNDAFFSVPLSDPACFAPVIKYVKSIAEKMNQDAVVNNYVVLLIITDGGITGEKI